MTNSIGEGPLAETILLIFVVSLSAVFCCWFVLVIRRFIEQFRNPSYDELNSPLLQEVGRATGRSSNNHDMMRRWLNNNSPADIYWECTLCGFDNNVNSESACILCGTQNNTTTSSGRGDFYTSPAATSGISGGGDDGSSNVQSNANAAGADTIFISEDAQIQVAKYSSFSLSERQRQVAQNYRRLNKLSLRQKGAMKRKLWRRKRNNLTGELSWVKEAPQESLWKKYFSPAKSDHKASSQWSREQWPGNSALALPLDGASKGTRANSSDNSASSRNISLSVSYGDLSIITDSPAFTSLFDEEGGLHWKRVESVSNSSDCEDDAPHDAHTDTYNLDKNNKENKDNNNIAAPFSNLRLDSFDLESVAALSFKDKQLWLLDRIADLQIPFSKGFVLIEVRRNFILTDTHRAFKMLKSADLHKYIRIQFSGESGYDTGGLKREWFNLVTTEIFNTSTGLFTYDPSTSSYHVDPTSQFNIGSEHLTYFKFIGRFLGKAIMEQQCISANLSLPLRKQLLSVPITFSDLEFVDDELYKHLKQLKKMSNAQKLSPAAFSISSFQLDFTVTYETRNNKMIHYDLVPDGGSKMVTAETLNDYLQARLRHRLLDSIKPQLESFLLGFYEILPPDLLSVFDYQELDLLLCGVPEISVQDWKKNTIYLGSYSSLGEMHPVIQWFWQCVEAMTREERARLLHFVTGSSRLPVQGFKALKANEESYRLFNIQSIEKQDSLYPRAHTCFNRIDLPIYAKQSEMETYMSIIVNMNVTDLCFNME